MIVFPNAKINLGLNILERRPDGFHNIESLLFPIKFTDVLEVIPAEPDFVPFASTGLKIPSNGKPNLCQQAYFLLKEKYSIPGVSIHLHKNIPSGSGLGGGSADAAFTLKLLNQLFSLGLTTVELKRLAAKLGSDCPVFIDNQSQFAAGRGDVLEPFKVNLSGFHLALIIPQVHVSTSEAYAGVKPDHPDTPLREVLGQPIERWKHLLKNDFEESVFRKFPSLASIKRDLYQFGAVYASMSGSGSAIFGLFEKTPGKRLQESFRDSHFWVEALD
ncbi:MAG: 4-(cytidine 5'-diphospho)-2-C-methyl-D-erythritol kinase [Bacteroides sp.]|nr:4-(cytidine 5'-diphospho)-2-C-methyl-D-erythritol kinase [Bacteroides sp.]